MIDIHEIGKKKLIKYGIVKSIEYEGELVDFDFDKDVIKAFNVRNVEKYIRINSHTG